MDQKERIAYYADHCERLYRTTLPEERDYIQKLLDFCFPTFANADALSQSPPAGFDVQHSFDIKTPTDTALALLNLLIQSSSPEVQFFCLSRLKPLITTQFSTFSVETKLQLSGLPSTFVVNTHSPRLGFSLFKYCYDHPDLQTAVVTLLASILALLTRMGWLEMDDYRNVQQAVDVFLQASVEHRIIGLRMLAVIIQDINAPSPPQHTAKFRKAASGLRDTQLYGIFEMAFNTMGDLLRRAIPLDEKQDENMKDAAVDVLLQCLSFDFAGTSADESADDTGSIQIPKTWQPIFENESFIPTFFSAYREFGQQSSKVMECITLAASARRALFSISSARSHFLVSLMQGTREIILTEKGMDNTDNYNAFCRLLYRFRAAAPMNEVAEKPGYLDWIGSVSDFTLKGIKAWQWSPNTTVYLLGFWSRIVKSIAYYQQLDETIVKKIEAATVEITRTYIMTNLASVPTRRAENLEDPLEEEDSLVESLDMLGQIARFKYQESSAELASVFDPITSEYQGLVNQATMGIATAENVKDELEVIEVKFAWLVYIMAAFVGNRPSSSGSYASDPMDSKLTTKVLQLMYDNEGMRRQYGTIFLNKRLDSALIYFFLQFRKSFIGDSSVKIYSTLSETAGISDQATMIDMMVKKIVANLQCWGDDEHVIYRTLQLFKDLATGFSAVRDLRKTQTTRLILQNHMSSEFAFLHSTQHRHNRMFYYQILSRVLFTDEIDEREFYAFIQPFEERLDALIALDSPAAFQQEVIKEKLQCIFRDLRGFILPIQAARHYQLFFDWFFPAYTPILCRALEALSPDPTVNALLKFVAEFVHNKSQRLHYEVSSANGILLFREISQIICTYGRAVTKQTVTSESDKYSQKYKGISICFETLALCLKGGYINFGVFWLYQDKAIDEVFGTMVQLMRCVPVQDLMNFPKLARAYFHFLDEFAREQLMVLPSLLPEDFLYLIKTTELGIDATDTIVRSYACSALTHIFSFVVKTSEKASLGRDAVSATARRRSSSAGSHWLLGYFQQYTEVMPTLLTALFGSILFDDPKEQWQTSRPLYVLMLLQKEFAFKYLDKVKDQQLPERRDYVAKELNTLTEGIGWTPCIKDRNRFSQNVGHFRRELSRNNVVLIPLPPVF